MKIALAQLNPIMGDLEGNAQRIRNTALSSGADIVVFSEMTITGYPPEDMVLKPLFQKESMRIARQLAEDLADGPAVLVGALWEEEGKPLNVALLMEGGEIRTMQRKYDLPNYGVFDEKRVFAAGGLPQPLEFHGHKIGLMICEDMWNIKTAEALKGVDILLSMHASPFEIGKRDLRRKRARQAVERAGAPIVYVNQIGGQDDLVFDGGSFVLDKDGNEVLAMVECAEAVSCVVFENGQLQAEDVSSPRCSELESTYRVLMCGLRDYVEKNNFPGVILGLSGGIDSALSAAIAVDALGEERVRAYMLPSHYTSEESLQDANICAKMLGIRLDTIPIVGAYKVLEDALANHFRKSRDITEENMQSRLRGLILMALSNKHGFMVLTTGNKSEYATGYATLYGDMCGGYNVLKDVYKTLVFQLSKWRNRHRPLGGLGPKGKVMPQNVIIKAPTAELRENQKDEDALPPYEVLDPILHMLIEEDMSVESVVKEGFDAEMVHRVVTMLYRSEYKRQQSAPGVKISPKYFGRDRRYPMTNHFLDGVES